MTTRDDIITYATVMRMYDALDECDRALCSSYYLKNLMSEEQVKKFKETWDKVYDELAHTLEYARAFALKKCLEEN